jgi:hypothetical protein
VDLMTVRPKQRQSGQAIALAAVAMIAVVGAVAFVIDLGFFLEGRRELQNTADSAALAGVVFLPNCSVPSASCPALSNAQDAANAYITANGPIVRQLCGHPTVSVDPSATAAPGIYDTSTTQPGLYYTLTVSLSCNPGFSFGRILFGSLQQPIAASATAVIGSLGEISCSAPLDVVAYSWGDNGNNYGYVPGLGNIPGTNPGTLLPNETNYRPNPTILTFQAGAGSTPTVVQASTGTIWVPNQFANQPITFTSGQDKFDTRLILSNTATTITVSYAFTNNSDIPNAPASGDTFIIGSPFLNALSNLPSNAPLTDCPDSGNCSPSFELTNNVGNYTGDGGAFLELCLNGGSCGGADIRDWFAGNPCLPLSVDSLQTTATAPGDHVGPTAQGLVDRGFTDVAGQSADCPQSISQVVDTTTWKVLPNAVASPCLIDLAILDYADLVANGRANVHIRAFGTMFLKHFDGQGTNKYFEGVIVQAVHSGRVLSYRDNATHATRLIR